MTVGTNSQDSQNQDDSLNREHFVDVICEYFDHGYTEYYINFGDAAIESYKKFISQINNPELLRKIIEEDQDESLDPKKFSATIDRIRDALSAM